MIIHIIHICIFYRIAVVLEIRRSSWGGKGCAPLLDPPSRSACSKYHHLPSPLPGKQLNWAIATAQIYKRECKCIFIHLTSAYLEAVHVSFSLINGTVQPFVTWGDTQRWVVRPQLTSSIFSFCEEVTQKCWPMRARQLQKRDFKRKTTGRVASNVAIGL